MEQRKPRITQEEELLALASERVEIPQGKLELEYQPDADILAIRILPRLVATHSKGDMKNGLIFNYNDDKLVSIEILDLYGVFA